MNTVKNAGLIGAVSLALLLGFTTAKAEDNAAQAKDAVTVNCEKEAADTGLTDKEDISAYVAECVAAVQAEQTGGKATDTQ